MALKKKPTSALPDAFPSRVMTSSPTSFIDVFRRWYVAKSSSKSRLTLNRSMAEARSFEMARSVDIAGAFS